MIPFDPETYMLPRASLTPRPGPERIKFLGGIFSRRFLDFHTIRWIFSPARASLRGLNRWVNDFLPTPPPLASSSSFSRISLYLSRCPCRAKIGLDVLGTRAHSLRGVELVIPTKRFDIQRNSLVEWSRWSSQMTSWRCCDSSWRSGVVAIK